jgi:hypothetical protein
MSSQSDSDNVRQPEDWNLETGCSDQDEGIGGAANKSEVLQTQRDPTTATDTTAKATMTTNGHPDTADLNQPCTLPLGDLVDAKNTVRSYSVATVAASPVTSAGVINSMPDNKDQVLERDIIGSQRSAGSHSQPTNRNNIIPASSHSSSLLDYKDQERMAAHDNLPSVAVQTTGMNQRHNRNITLGGNQKQLMLVDSFCDYGDQVILPLTGYAKVCDEQLPVYKDQAIPEGGTHYNASAEQDLTPGSYSTPGGGAADTNITRSASAGAVAVFPTRCPPFAPPNPPSLPATEIQEHLLVATVVPDSAVNAASRDSNVVMAVPLTGRYWKVLLGMLVIVLAVGAVIGGVCGTGGCFSSSPTTVPFGSPPTLVVSPTVSPTVSPRAEQVTSFINNITLTGRTIAVSAESNDTSLDLEVLALCWLIDYDKDLPDTPTNCFHLQQRYALAILQVQQEGAHAFLGSDDNECTWNGVTCQNVSLGTELGIREAVTEVYIDTYNNGSLWIGRLSADLGLLSTLIQIKMNGDATDVKRGGLVGTLPSQIGKLTSLQTLDLAFNRLTGSLPTQIGQLTNLSSLGVTQNTLRGSLPSQIGQLTTLQSLDLSYNELSGILISEIGQLTNLQDLNVFYNDMSGSLPNEIGQLTSLIFLSVSDNTLTGSVPCQIGKLTNMQYLYMDGNNFIGTMPYSVCLLRNQSLFDLWADCVSEVLCNCCNDCF